MRVCDRCKNQSDKRGGITLSNPNGDEKHHKLIDLCDACIVELEDYWLRFSGESGKSRLIERLKMSL